MPTAILISITFLFGITTGSFLNVCILRIPEGEDIVHTDSHCMSCGYRLLWFDLIPVLSWLMLKGRCRKCGKAISIQYPLAELLNGFIWAGLIGMKGLTPAGICCCVAASALLVLSFIDFRTYQIPPGCNVVILICGLVNLIFDREQWMSYAIGFVIVSGLLLLILLASRGRAMGGGDVKLMAAAGLLLGWKEILLALTVGCIAGSVIHLTLMKVKGRDHMLAFGPYLSLGIWCSMMWGTQYIHWYLGLFLR